MKTSNLTLRCYAKRVPAGHWEAFCIDLCLAAQADTLQEVRQKLHEQVVSYVLEALTIDAAYADQLFERKAPLAQRIEYRLIRLMQKLHVLRNDLRLVFREALPMVPNASAA